MLKLQYIILSIQSRLYNPLTLAAAYATAHETTSNICNKAAS